MTCRLHPYHDVLSAALRIICHRQRLNSGDHLFERFLWESRESFVYLWIDPKCICMKKLWPLILAMVMVIASCDKYSEEEYEPIYVHDISVNGNSVTIRAKVNETYLNLYGFEVGASYSMAPTSQVSIGYLRVSRGSFARKRAYFQAQTCAIRILLPSSRIFIAAFISLSNSLPHEQR